MKSTLRIGFESLAAGFGRLGNRAAKYMGIDTVARKEARIQKYFNIHDRYLFPTDAPYQLYLMREPIARFAQKNNLKIDVYNPSNIKTSDFFTVGNPDEFSEQIALVVSDRSNKKMKVQLINADTSIDYPKESVRTFLLPIKGEDTQIARKIKSTTNDNFLRNVFREIENMAREINNKKLK